MNTTATSLDTPCGSIPVHGPVERFPDGGPRSCTPCGPAALATRFGTLVPQHSTDDLRRRTVQALTFHPGGLPRCLPLEQPTRIETPAGVMDAELLTFHPDGSLRRAFPLNGKLSGYWTEADEGALAKTMEVSTPLGRLTAKIISLCFHPCGTLASITLWPGEEVALPTPAGTLAARVGMAFRPDGSLRSIEPARPQAVPTPAGSIMAYDLDAVGICGDANSLCFAPDGRVEGVTTSLTRVLARREDGSEQVFAPGTRESLCGDAERESAPMRLEFAPGVARIRSGWRAPWVRLELSRVRLRAEPALTGFALGPGAVLARASCGI